jgi:protein phosphatase
MNIEDKSGRGPEAGRSGSDADDHQDRRRIAFHVDVGATSHQGPVRDLNEDHFLVMRFGRSLNNLLTNLDEGILEPDHSATGYGMLVADGIGGMAAGDEASRWALAQLVELLVETPDWIMKFERTEGITVVLQRMTERFLNIDETLKDKARWDVTLRGMGTTLTVACTLGSDLVIGHVGDSRAYLLRGDELKQLTTDHTLAQTLIDAGIAGRDDPAPRSMRHVLTAALGALGERIEPQVQHVKVRQGDQLLLCTDGLTEMVEDSALAKALFDAKSAQAACDNLVDLALAAGGVDNVTAVVYRFAPSSPGARMLELV